MLAFWMVSKRVLRGSGERPRYSHVLSAGNMLRNFVLDTRYRLMTEFLVSSKRSGVSGKLSMRSMKAVMASGVLSAWHPM